MSVNVGFDVRPELSLQRSQLEQADLCPSEIIGVSVTMTMRDEYMVWRERKP